MSQHPGKDLGHHVPLILADSGEVDVHSVARLVCQRLWTEIGIQPVPGRHRIHRRPEGHGVICRSNRVRIAEINFVLAGALLMVRAFRPDAHAFQRQADLPADILPLVCRGNVHVTGTVIGNFGRLAVLVQPEQIEFHLRSEGKGQSGLFGVLYRFFQQAPGVRADDGAVWLGHGAEHPHHPSMLRPPGQHTEGGRVRAQQQIRVDLPAEAGNGGAVDGDTVLEGPVQFLRHNGDIFLAARRVAEGHADELHVLLRRILLDLLNRILHIVSAFPLWFPYACPAIQAPSFFDATVIAHLFINLQYVKQKKIMVFRDLFSVMLTYWGYCCRSGLLSCFALCGDPFPTASPFCNKKGVHFQREPCSL